MEFNYYYGSESEMFSFFRLPKMLIQDKRFSNLKSDSKLLYGIMLDRMSLSQKNGWLDDENRVYIIFTVKNITEEFNCSERKAIMLLQELEQIHLIEKRRQGQGLPNIIYVNNIFVAAEHIEEAADRSKEKENEGIVSKKRDEDVEVVLRQKQNITVSKSSYAKKDSTLSPGEVNKFQTCKNVQVKKCKFLQVKRCKNMRVKKCKFLQVKKCKNVHPNKTNNNKTDNSIKDTLKLKDKLRRVEEYEPWFDPESPEVSLTRQFINQLQVDQLPTERFPEYGELFDMWVTPISQLLRAGFTAGQIAKTIEYLNLDDFWKPQIRNTRKFKTEFERLYLKAKNSNIYKEGKSKFSNFSEREYDMDELQRRLIQ
ncbi:hypothetical protein M2454_000765 [Aequitasia blattaphilus]|uniref:Replication initiator protein A n=1 Tax=Aequitasia blattaphilus TaxID=2949332 RepID=A0ABT1EAJ2_9FIRM|nr:replication initiator protein A [Aequitasia blattaphilus]MCP1101972.1 replication initiator protein A [Aequitasia blattaphilus]MCR8614612.1 replication initiator protein A [Aequitasia blattaphilus]